MNQQFLIALMIQLMICEISLIIVGGVVAAKLDQAVKELRAIKRRKS